jgi:hypothetical protein
LPWLSQSIRREKPYFFVNGWDENVTNVIFSRLIDWDSQGKLVPGLGSDQGAI